MLEKYIVSGYITSHRYKTEVGEISLVHPSRYTMDSYEIFSTEGDLFFDVERYKTLEEAEERIYDLLDVKRLNRESKINDIIK